MSQQRVTNQKDLEVLKKLSEATKRRLTGYPNGTAPCRPKKLTLIQRLLKRI